MGDTQCRPYIVVDLCDIRHIIGSGAIALGIGRLGFRCLPTSAVARDINPKINHSRSPVTTWLAENMLELFAGERAKLAPAVSEMTAARNQADFRKKRESPIFLEQQSVTQSKNE